MRAQILSSVPSTLELRDVDDPVAAAGQLRLRVRACGVCRTDLHVVDGELAHPKLPLVPGHERCLRACGDAKRIGLHGFGAAAHIVAQVAARDPLRPRGCARPRRAARRRQRRRRRLRRHPLSDVPAFPYELFWGERVVRSIANLTRRDGVEFFDVAHRLRLVTEVVPFALKFANDALSRLRDGRLVGAAVLTMNS